MNYGKERQPLLRLWIRMISYPKCAFKTVGDRRKR
jgi:hypothetical protein